MMMNKYYISKLMSLCGFCLLMFSHNATAAGCGTTANIQRMACTFDLRDDFHTSKAQCYDVINQDEECFSDAEEEFDEGQEECDAILEARLELCEALNDEVHEPAFGPDFAENFVDPLDIGGAITPNPWFALVPGNHWVYEGDGETIDVVVTSDTKLIDGVTCIVVIDTATEEEVVVEITRDWYAQDTDGNVWYCGEISENFEEFDGDETSGPELVDIDGSWKAGRDGAEAGILLPFTPAVGQYFRQEFAQTDAEDVIEVLALDASETSPGGSCENSCLQTRDFTPLDTEPGVEENKYYVHGIGLIVEVKPGSDERVELIEFTGVGQ